MLNDGCILVVEDLKEEALQIVKPFQLKKQNEYGITVLQIIKYER